ncbi:hypothetical protein BKA58DRAFT_394719 [Alternaria rosae]|uniref:uncharacterized protein n=1 Tax=Alternaria rosae TaxID=1187941 RepID=UPI001E8CDFED|nr:uncharacterized protein BKA58DRAFT_394719 [Alternaria rosae]KAH6853020.1 hypothetical protein BKA58DRAFT_394719 [Alternaria rosae]
MLGRVRPATVIRFLLYCILYTCNSVKATVERIPIRNSCRLDKSTYCETLFLPWQYVDLVCDTSLIPCSLSLSSRSHPSSLSSSLLPCRRTRCHCPCSDCLPFLAQKLYCRKRNAPKHRLSSNQPLHRTLDIQP